MPSFVVQFDLKKINLLKETLVNQGFTLTNPPYTHFSGKKKGVSCTLYTSGKLVIQGKEMEMFIKYTLEPQVLEQFTYGYEKLEQNKEPHIGIDESGKGDFFGPLCIAGVFADSEGIEGLLKIGVKDSKKLKDDTILKIAQKIRKDYLYHIVKIGPPKYNALITRFGNLNLLLGWGHSVCASELVEKSGCHKVVLDQFAAEHVALKAMEKKNHKIELTQRPRAEVDVVVAAASILARAAFVMEMADLEKEFGTKLPKGASSAVIRMGKQLVSKHGAEILHRLSKVHFKTTKQILEGAV
ncbi:MAG: ribonuclease HIII [Chlamydiia bacterium]|nr:ribonuclease HIII [Chlamydiia bacterium]